MGRIRRAPEEPGTDSLSVHTANSRATAEKIAVKQLRKRGVPRNRAKELASWAGWSWCDHFPTVSAIRIFED